MKKALFLVLLYFVCQFVATLPAQEATKLLQRYGKRLVDAEPEATTSLLLQLCAAPANVEPDRFFHCFVDNAAALKSFLQSVVAIRPDCGTIVWNTLLELLLRRDLEPTESREAHVEKVMELLRDPRAKYDPDEALFLLQRGKCEEGLLFVCVKLQLNGVLVRLYFEGGQREEAMKLCEKEKTDDALWELLLQLYAESEDYPKKEEEGEKGEEEEKSSDVNIESENNNTNESENNNTNESENNNTNEKENNTSEPTTDPKDANPRHTQLIDRQELERVIAKVLESGCVPLLRIVQILSENPHIDASLIRQVIIAQLEEEKRLREEVETNIDVNDRTSSRPSSSASSESAWNRSLLASRATRSH